MGPGDPPLGRPLTRQRLLLAAVGLLATLAALPGAWAPSTYGAETSADEPHYLLTAIALAERGSLDIAPLLRAEAWRPFHAAPLPQQAAAGEHGRLVAPHDPLLPVLLAGPVRLAGWRAGRLALAVVNGLLAVALAWTASHRLKVPPRLAAGVALLACASAPFVVYGSQVYPELPAALAVTGAIAAGLGPVRAATAAGVVAAVIALPWLSVKYAPVAAVLAILHLLALRRGRRRRLMVACVAAYVAAGALYILAHLAWYGGLTVYAAGDFFAEHGGQLAVLGTQPDYLGRTRRLLGLLVDRGFGLAAWQPAWLLLVPALAALLRRRPPGWRWLAAPLATGWLLATFAAVTMHGWWFPGRHVLHALPAAVLAVACWLAGERRRVRLAAAAAGLLGVWSTGWVIGGAVLGRRTMIVDFAATADPWYRLWSRLLPDYFTVTPVTWVLHALWLGLLLAVVVWTLRRAPVSAQPALVRRAAPAYGARTPVRLAPGKAGEVPMEDMDDMAGVKAIPDGYPQVTPYLIVDGAEAAIAFYATVFGTTERMRMPGPDGTIGHAELQLGEAVLMVADEFPDMGLRGPKALGGTPVTISVYVDDVDAVIARAVEAGATSLRPVEDQFYGDRSGQFEDPFGHRWSVATHVEDVSPEEMAARAARAAQEG